MVGVHNEQNCSENEGTGEKRAALVRDIAIRVISKQRLSAYFCQNLIFATLCTGEITSVVLTLKEG